MADCLMITQNDGTAKPVGVVQGDAKDIKYSNIRSGLTSTNTQDAIDEINSKCPSSLEFDTIALVSSLPAEPDNRTLYLTTS